MSAPIAVVTAVASAVVLGISSVADQRSTKRVESRRALSPRIMVDLVRQPLWLTAVGANIAGFALQVVALGFGSLALVQTILACDLMFAVLILWYQGHRANLKVSKVKQMVAGVAATTVGVVGFLAIGQPSGGRAQVSFGILPPLAIGIVVVAGGCLAVAARNRTLRPLALALACGDMQPHPTAPPRAGHSPPRPAKQEPLGELGSALRVTSDTGCPSEDREWGQGEERSIFDASRNGPPSRERGTLNRWFRAGPGVARDRRPGHRPVITRVRRAPRRATLRRVPPADQMRRRLAPRAPAVRAWDRQVPVLLGAGHRGITYDRRGLTRHPVR